MKLNLLSLLVFVLMLGTLPSCKKDETLASSPERVFKPIGTSGTSAETEYKLTWSPSLYTTGKKVNYLVEVAADSTFQQVLYSTTTDTTGIVFKFPDLAVKTAYIARIKALGENGQADSKWTVVAFKIKGAEIFKALTSSNVVDNAVKLEFEGRTTLTKIVLTRTDGTFVEVAITSGDIAAGNKIISGLLSDTQYKAEIFAGDLTQGTIVFRTKAGLTGAIVDLRELVAARPSVLNDTLNSPNLPNGAIILLKRGATYNISTTALLSKSFTITSGDDINNADKVASIYFTSNFNFSAGANIDYIEFKDVKMYSDNYTSRYIFNTTNGANVEKINFDGCRISIFRGVTRLQSGATTVGTYSVNNCVVDSIAGYGVLTVDNIACKANIINLKNSTFYKADKILVSRQNSTSVTIENCTFNEAPLGGGSNYLIDYSTSPTNVVSGGISLKNTILGVAKLSGTSVAVRGMRYGAGTSVIVDNTYSTSDYSATSNIIADLKAAGFTSKELFSGPATGDFTIKASGFAGKSTSGDPRWRIQ